MSKNDIIVFFLFLSNLLTNCKLFKGSLAHSGIPAQFGGLIQGIPHKEQGKPRSEAVASTRSPSSFYFQHMTRTTKLHYKPG